MVKMKHGLVALGALGLVMSSPAFAQTRAGDSLPSASIDLDPASVARASAPAQNASALGNDDDDLSPAVILGFIALLALLIALAAGGGGGGNDSPG